LEIPTGLNTSLEVLSTIGRTNELCEFLGQGNSKSNVALKSRLLQYKSKILLLSGTEGCQEMLKSTLDKIDRALEKFGPTDSESDTGATRVPSLGPKNVLETKQGITNGAETDKRSAMGVAQSFNLPPKNNHPFFSQ
jgi:hypothetical protein